MGRELRRVPLDFDWPLNRPWEGFVNPHGRPCPKQELGACVSGYTTDGKWLDIFVHLMLMLGADSCRPDRGLHPWLQDLPLAPRRHMSQSLVRPTAAFTALTTRLAGRAPCGGLGHDGLDRHSAYEALLRAFDLPDSWGTCPVCGGDGMDPGSRAAYEAWTEQPPPEGPGYQVWESVSDGSPVSPVFETADACIAWLAVDQEYSRPAAERFVRETHWAPSAMIVDGKLHRDIETSAIPGAVRAEKEEEEEHDG